MTVPERLAALRQKMAEAGVDAYLVPTDDFHGSEYVGDFFKCRKYITGFTGSAGTALIMQDMAGLWTDGRYFLQAEQQLAGSGVTLFRMRDEGVPTIEEFLGQKMTGGMTLGFDGRTVTAVNGRKYETLLAKKHAAIRCDLDLVGEIWTDRPALSAQPVWLLDE
ncbi:MAG: aminopeptidase P family N-terminal domain-containing protein, partial [Lachnospiraceae bacterium]|nr:aminopeptidase P family N-terminal domain-containing protein [Lachnospiraceae bacterium]